MNPLTILWIASLIGAGLFFASGWLSSRGLYERRGVVRPELPVGNDAERQRTEEALRLEVAHQQALADGARRDAQAFVDNARREAEALTERARNEAEGLRRQLHLEIASKGDLNGELSQARSQVTGLSERLGEAQQSLAELSAMRSKMDELDGAQSQKADAADKWQRRARVLERQLVEARETQERLQGQLSAQVEGTNATLSSDVKRLNEEQQERNLRLKMMSNRIAELETYAEQNAVLQGERDALGREVDRLRRLAQGSLTPPRPASATAEAPPSAGMTITRPSQSGTTRRVTESEDTLESNLQQHLTSLMHREPGLIAVVSDDNGFPVSGVGTDQEQEGVCVLTSLAQQLAERVEEFVKLDSIERMELADASGRALRVRFFDWESQPLALGCLGKRTLAPNQDEELVVSSFPKILRRAWSA